MKLTRKTFPEVMAAIRRQAEASGSNEGHDAILYVATITQVLENHVADKKPGTAALVQALDDMLNDLLGDDAFGTEGQNDPRGDHRDEEEDES